MGVFDDWMKEKNYTEKLEEGLSEYIIAEIHLEQAKWYNPTFTIPNPLGKRRVILDASSMNNEIQTVQFNMNGTDQVRDLISNRDWTICLAQTLIFHRQILSPSHGQYLTFKTIVKVYQFRPMPLGTQHSPTFFAHALAMVVTKKRRKSDIRIFNFVDDMLLLHQNIERLQEQTQTNVIILEAIR
ncbi:MAG: hypothetical protein EZS28_032181 [Streblomastix strix]|uniref:Reverse transcriptase domain-containing protein n=1 Tax=Streblomastix strix TaxID=222440 RepID=A0A5J4UQ22_9EUKA|nr:MAG: hypothetical protein EZS28_032181 [Streblomastix strix]